MDGIFDSVNEALKGWFTAFDVLHQPVPWFLSPIGHWENFINSQYPYLLYVVYFLFAIVAYSVFMKLVVLCVDWMDEGQKKPVRAGLSKTDAGNVENPEKALNG